MKVRKPVFVSVILSVAAATTLFAVSCGDDYTTPKTYTMSFETYGGTQIDPISALGDSMIFAPSNPQKSGSTFAGWYTNADFSGASVQIPNKMPKKNITYYAKFDADKVEYTVTYEYNIGKAPHAADIPNVTVEAGGKVTVADGNDYGAEGYMFMGWSIYQSGYVDDVKQDGQYNPGDEITLTDSNIKLYAQWAVEYTDSREQNADKIYVYAPLVDKGKGAAKLIRADKQKDNLEGFVKSADQTESGYSEFTFYADEFTNGEFTGRLYANRTYATSDSVHGMYAMYDYVFGDIWYENIMALDGFGFATYFERRGDMLYASASGDYEYDPDYGYKFTFTRQTDEAGAKPQTTYFVLERCAVEGPGEGEEKIEYDGLFSQIGMEIGEYDNIDGYYWSLELNGYGSAMLSIYDDDGKTVIKTVQGDYYGTEYYESEMGEWQFEPSAAINDGFAFKFLAGVIAYNGEYYYVFRMCDETVAGEYTSADDGDKSTLYLDGYGMAQYTSQGVIYEGNCTVTENGVATLVYTTELNGETVESKMVFVLNGKKFSLSADGLIISNGVLSQYTGESAVVVIPDTVTEIADGALNCNNDDNSGVSLISVTIPDTVTTIGARAFENNYTLRRAIFLSDTPVALDLSDANDPFRWAAGDFIIVVPQDDDVIDLYKTAWAKYADKIVGSEDAAKLPEFEVNADGVLIRYNKPEDLEEGELLDIIIPDEVTEIAAYVFSGVTGIRSVNLNNVTKIGDRAFYGCADLQKVIFAKYDEEDALITGVEEIGVMAFAACTKLNNSGEANVLELPAIKSIGESAFSSCESLRLVRLGEDIENIDGLAFYLCNVYENDPPLFVELMGENPPTMGEKVALGNISFRIKVQNVKVALKCYKDSSWSAYCRHLYVESGEEKGTYISGDDTLVLDGRAVYQSSYIWMYEIVGEKITFYEYDSSNASYSTLVGTYKNDEISFVLGSKTRRFTRLQEQMTYTSKDGKYTLECNPMDLQPESYENNNGYATVKFNGVEVELFINGYSTKIIYGFEEGGKLYDIYISFDGETLEVTKKLSDIRYSDITAPDGSKITILFRNGLIYIEKAEFEIPVDTDRKLYWTEASGMGVFAEQNGNVFTFSFRFRSDTYNFTVTVSEDYKTFTYTHTKA